MVGVFFVIIDFCVQVWHVSLCVNLCDGYFLNGGKCLEFYYRKAVSATMIVWHLQEPRPKICSRLSRHSHRERCGARERLVWVGSH